MWMAEVHGSRTHPRPRSWPSNRFEDGSMAAQTCSGVSKKGAREFKSRDFLLPSWPRVPTIFPGLAADLAADSRAVYSLPENSRPAIRVTRQVGDILGSCG